MTKFFFVALLLLNSVEQHNGASPSCSWRTSSGCPNLRQYNVDPKSTTVSGISNGGGFAAHIAFIHSSLIRGAGIFAASPYPMVYLIAKHVTRAVFDVTPYYPLIDHWSAIGGIDSTDNLKGFKAYVFKGLNDFIIHPRIVQNVATQFRHYGADVKDVTTSVECGHCVPTRNNRNHDSIPELIFGLQPLDVCNSGFQAIFDMFSHFYGDDYVEPESENTQPTGQLFRVDLAEFYPDCAPEVNSMNGTAWMYVPDACYPVNEGSSGNATKCRLHFAFHGYQLPWRVRMFGSNNAFVEDAGYLQAADANNIIILFPEALWRGYDIIGFTGPETFVLKSGLQNVAIRRMIERITQGL